jgi:hypothetical protein
LTTSPARRRTLIPFQLDLFSPNDGFYEYSVVVTDTKQWEAKELLLFVSGRSGQENSLIQIWYEDLDSRFEDLRKKHTFWNTRLNPPYWMGSLSAFEMLSGRGKFETHDYRKKSRKNEPVGLYLFTLR